MAQNCFTPNLFVQILRFLLKMFVTLIKKARKLILLSNNK